MFSVSPHIVTGATVVATHGTFVIVNFDDGPVFPVILGAAGNFENAHVVSDALFRWLFRYGAAEGGGLGRCGWAKCNATHQQGYE